MDKVGGVMNRDELKHIEQDNLNYNYDLIDAKLNEVNCRISYNEAKLEEYKNDYKHSNDFKIIKNRFNDLSMELKSIQNMYKSPYFGHMYLNNSEYDENMYIGEESICYKGKNIVYDWRSPVAKYYYDKSDDSTIIYNDTKYNVDFKRRVNIKNQKVIDCFEIYNSNTRTYCDESLLSILEEKRYDSNFTDIIKSIQSNQNSIIRQEPNANIFCQGVAGSGKTVIIVHRLSYLLYNYSNINTNSILFIVSNDKLKQELLSLTKKLGVQNINMMTMYEYYIGKFNYYLNVNVGNTGDKLKIKHIVDDENIDVEEQYSKLTLDKKYKIVEKILLNQINEIVSIAQVTLLNDSSSLIVKCRDLYKKLGNNFYLKQKLEEIVKPRNIIKLCFENICTILYKLNSNISNRTFKRIDIFSILYILERIGVKHDVNSPYRYLYVDEVQDYNDWEIINLINLENLLSYNLFGDYKQSISKNVIERDNWSDLKALLGELKYFELNENYRNTNSIISFCNKEYNSNMKPLGRDGNNVVVKKLEDVESLIKDAIEHNAIIITNDDFLKERINEKSSVLVFNVQEVKGLEYVNVIVVDSGLSNNEKYVACTRALNELIVYSNY